MDIKRGSVFHRGPEILGGTLVFVGTRVPIELRVQHPKRRRKFWMTFRPRDGNRHWNVALRRKEYPCPLSTDEHVATVDVRQQPFSVEGVVG